MNYTPRLPWAGTTLRDEIAQWDTDAKFAFAKKDGLGVFRVLEVTTEHAADLVDLLRTIHAVDRRITSVSLDEGVVSIAFHVGVIAEHRDPFHLARVEEMLRPEDETPDPEPAPAKKTAKKVAKKAAPKTED